MRLCYIAFFASFALSAVSAADMTGKWLVDAPTGAPASNETAYYFTAKGDAFTCYLSQGQNTSAITDGKVEGDSVTFNVVRQVGGIHTKVSYTARFNPAGLWASGAYHEGVTPETLTITIATAGRGGGERGRGQAFSFGAPPAANSPAGPPQPIGQVARRVSTTVPPPMPVPPVKVNLNRPPSGVKYSGPATTPPREQLK